MKKGKNNNHQTCICKTFIRFLFVLDAVTSMGKSVNQIAFHNQICVECTRIGNALAFILII